jgi:hypothetical protein
MNKVTYQVAELGRASDVTREQSGGAGDPSPGSLGQFFPAID